MFEKLLANKNDNLEVAGSVLTTEIRTFVRSEVDRPLHQGPQGPTMEMARGGLRISPPVAAFSLFCFDHSRLAGRLWSSLPRLPAYSDQDDRQQEQDYEVLEKLREPHNDHLPSCTPRSGTSPGCRAREDRRAPRQGSILPYICAKDT